MALSRPSRLPDGVKTCLVATTAVREPWTRNSAVSSVHPLWSEAAEATALWRLGGGQGMELPTGACLRVALAATGKKGGIRDGQGLSPEPTSPLDREWGNLAPTPHWASVFPNCTVRVGPTCQREKTHLRVSSPSHKAGQQSSGVPQGANVSPHALARCPASEFMKEMQRGG